MSNYNWEPSKSIRPCFVTVSQCRFCGAIIPSTEGGERHGKVCRILDNLPTKQEIKMMTSFDFPCPIVRIRKILPFAEPKPKPSVKLKRHKTADPDDDLQAQPRRRKSSLRALEFLRQLSSTDEEDEETGKAELSEDAEEENDIAATSSNEKKTPKLYSANKKGQYTCPYGNCGSVVHSVGKLKEHFLMHLENSPFACPYPGCSRKLRGRCHFKRHMEWHEGKDLMLCNKCGRFITKFQKKKGRSWRDHVCIPGYRKRKTEEVPSGFHNALSYSRYLNGINNVPEEVAKILKSREQKTITEIIIADPVFQEVCKENPGFRELIVTNRKLFPKSASSEKYQCSKCQSAFLSLKLLKQHILDRHTNRPWRCSKCGRTFLKENLLKWHMKFHKSIGNDVHMRQEDSGKWSCTECGFQSRFESSVRRHWRLIHNVVIPKPREVLFSAKAEERQRKQRKGKVKKKALPPPLSSTSEEESEWEQEEADFKTSASASDGVKTERVDSSVWTVKVEAEPALELVMIKAEDVEVNLKVKREVDSEI